MASPLTFPDFAGYVRTVTGEVPEELEAAVLRPLFASFLEESAFRTLARDRRLEFSAAPGDAQKALLASLDLQDPDPVAVEERYQAQLDLFRREESVELVQLLIQDLESARDARTALVEGRSLERVVGDLEAGELGGQGSQGQYARGDLPEEFRDPVFGLQAGEVSEVLAADFGFHLFVVERRFPERVLSLEEVRPELVEGIRREQAQAALASLRDEAWSRYNPEVVSRSLPFQYP